LQAATRGIYKMTVWLQAKNNAGSLLAGAVTANDTALQVKTGEGARFPSSFPFHVTVDSEIMECTGRAGDILTVTRAQENTMAAAHPANSTVRLNLTAAVISQAQSEIDARIAASVLAAKGDILTAAAAGTPACLGAGSEGQVLRSRQAEATGLKWENFPLGTAYAASGTYTGNSSANRPIAHELGVVPRVVFIQNQTDTSALFFFIIFPGFSYMVSFQLTGGSWLSESNITNLSVTQMDGNNFYIGHAGSYASTANLAGKSYRWAALG
jgi:hypothetical protein